MCIRDRLSCQKFRSGVRMEILCGKRAWRYLGQVYDQARAVGQHLSVKPVDVGGAVERVICSICGADQAKTCCQHWPGREYDGHLCVMELDGARDAYEVSLVAVPAQPDAGIIKSKRYGGQDGPQEPPADTGEKEALRMAQAMQEQETSVSYTHLGPLQIWADRPCTWYQSPKS